MQAYAAAYFVLPTIRWLQNKRKNAAIEESNASRREAVARLGVPPPDLARKLSSARDMGRAGPKLITEKVHHRQLSFLRTCFASVFALINCRLQGAEIWSSSVLS